MTIQQQRKSSLGRVLSGAILPALALGCVLVPSALHASVGSTVLRKVPRILGKEVGETAASRLTRALAKYGDDGAKLLRRVGPELAEQAVRHSDDAVRMGLGLSDDVARFAMRNIDKTLPVWRRHGAAGVELLARHPGLGERALKLFGKEGIEICGRLPARRMQQAVILAEKSGPGQAKLIMDALRKHGDPVLDFLWRNKGGLLVGGGLVALLTQYEERSISPSGEVRITSQSFMQRLAENGLKSLFDTYPVILLIGAGLALYHVWLGLSPLRRLLSLLNRPRRQEQPGQGGPAGAAGRAASSAD